MTKLRDWLEVIGIFAVSLFIFTWNIAHQEVIGFESRFYLFALEMWRHGLSWFPTAYYKPYPDYPVTSTLLIYLAASLLGSMNKLAAILPSAIAASITVTITYLIGALRNKWWGIYAACFLLFTVTFLKIARSISLDVYPMLITACCFYIVYNADVKHKAEYVGWIYLLFWLGFAFRGPIGLIIPAGVVCTYYLFDKNLRSMFFAGAFALLILIVSMGVLLGIAHATGGHLFVEQVLLMEVVGRIDNGHLPYYYYFLESIGSYAITYPLAAAIFLGVIYYMWRLAHYSLDFKLLLKLFGWVMVVMVGMSVPGDKKVRYILAIAPALALIASYPLVAAAGEQYFVKLRWLISRGLLIVPLVSLIGFNYFHTYADSHSLGFPINYARISTVLSSLLSVSFLMFYRLKKKEQWFNLGVLVAATATFAYIYIYAVEPIEQYLDRTREFVTQMEDLRKQTRADLVFYKEHHDGLPIKYLINMPQEEIPQFINSEQELTAYPQPAFFVTSENYFNALPAPIAMQFHIVSRDIMGHVPVVVFSNR